jgi:hypothetical protein
MKGAVALGIKQEKGGFLELSAANADVASNGDFTISAATSGRARYAILYYPASNLYQQFTAQTGRRRVPK